jgi:peptidoglycan/xylan/chitin deacetylase (PgdA/CDA1 family)
MLKHTILLLIAAICFQTFTGCNKSVPQGKLPNGQVAITFDDASVDNWYEQLNFLDSLHIKATFYICSYHTLNSAQKQKLKEIESRGHEIAYHTANHLDLVKEVAKKGMAETEEKEINSDLLLMQRDGYKISNFAYPFGSHSTQLNTCLLRKFKSVRALSNKQNYNKSLVNEMGDWKVLYGANIDNNSRLKEDGIFNLMDKAREHNDCLVMVAHQINNPAIALQISRKRLELISRAAADRNLEFVTINQIAR